MTTILSIHQPNNELLQMFDKIYVLAKGGVCVYSGPPTQLRKHLIECQIECNEDQVPIELLIKISFEGIYNSKVKILCEKAKEIIKESMFGFNEMKIIKNGLNRSAKNFSLVDFWYVLLRLFHRNYISNFKIFVLQLVSFVVMIASSLLVIDENIYKSDGCIQLNIVPNMTCAQQREEESLSSTNAIFTTFLMVFSTITQLITIVFSYANDMKIFVSEHKNSEFRTLNSSSL